MDLASFNIGEALGAAVMLGFMLAAAKGMLAQLRARCDAEVALAQLAAAVEVEATEVGVTPDLAAALDKAYAHLPGFARRFAPSADGDNVVPFNRPAA